MKGAHNISNTGNILRTNTYIYKHTHTHTHTHTYYRSYDHRLGMIVILLAPILEERNLLVHGMLMVVLERNKLANFYTVAH